MINAADLRIGNWVDFGYTHAKEFKRRPCQVISIRENEVVVLDKGVSLVAEFYPILLSSEILEACGFTHKIFEDTSYYIQNDLWFCHSGDNWFLSTHTNYNPLHSLHQLQNLYHSLTGTELTYKPLK